MSTGERVTVIMAAYNARKSISAALKSVLQQTHPAAEIIVVDDGSTDDTAEIVEGMYPTVRLITQQNGGPSAARNRGLSESAGSLLAFLDADDIWPENGVERLLFHLASNPQYEIIQGQVCDYWREDEMNIPQIGAPYHGLNLGSALFRRSLFERIGTFDSELQKGEDFNFWVRIKEAGIAHLFIKEPTLYYRRKPGNILEDQKISISSRLHALKGHLDRKRRDRGSFLC